MIVSQKKTSAVSSSKEHLVCVLAASASVYGSVRVYH